MKGSQINVKFANVFSRSLEQLFSRNSSELFLKQWYFVAKIVVRKNCSSDREKTFEIEAEGREFAKGEQDSQIWMPECDSFPLFSR